MPSTSTGRSSTATSCSSAGDSIGELLVDREHPSFSEWSPGAVVVEMKVNEAAVVSVFCPPPADEEGGSSAVELVKFTGGHDRSSETPSIQRFGVQFTNLQFDPDSVSDELWSESRRLFTCRVQPMYRDHVCGLRKFSDLQSYMSGKLPLPAYCERLTHNGARATCRTCMTVLFETSDHNSMKFVPFSNPEGSDEFEAAGADEFALHSCANQHKHEGGGDAKDEEEEGGLLKMTTGKKTPASPPGRPPADRRQDVPLRLDELNNLTAEADTRIVRCRGCGSELGRTAKINPNVFQLHLSGLLFEDQNLQREVTSERFGSTERFFAFLLLRHSALDSSLKLVFRTFGRESYLLIWLIEPIFVFAGGRLAEITGDAKPKPKGKRKKSDVDSSIITSFCALKVLYKVYDSDCPTGSNGKPNGVDSTVSFVDVPLQTCMQLEEILLRNSARLPDAMRSLGNFMISFLDMDDD
ncbi:E3 ubiquitin-protein ligase E3D [Aphelenchoides fujianensis]|nr:E3 ubiquitin-protein ligase E3D [Aphelenchoides fujianensis]